jgi:renalase
VYRFPVRIVVIGAGIAGLSAARRLTSQGHSVLVLDKGRAPGGRVATRRVMAASDLFQFDHGAQYFTVRDPRFEDEARRWADLGRVRPWRARLASFDSEGREAVEDKVERWTGVPGMSALGRQLADGLDVRPLTRVVALDHRSGTWTADTDTGERHSGFDAVVVAVPAPQAVDLIGASTGLAAEAAAVTMRPCWAVLTAFEEPVPVRFDAAFVLSSPLGWIARDGSKPKRGGVETWVLHATTAWSAAHVNDARDAVGPFLLNAFAALVPKGLPVPVHLSVHRWRYAVADPPLARGALVDLDLRLAVCGDWCLGARIESAWLSGVAAAEALIAGG